MVYHAARACAMVGYIDLYRGLDVFLEVHVTEKAFHASANRNNRGSEAIRQDITAPAGTYAFINEYSEYH